LRAATASVIDQEGKNRNAGIRLRGVETMTDTALKERIIHGLSKWGKWILIVILVMTGFYWLRIRPLPVKGYQVAQGEIVAELMGTGTLEAKVQTIVSTKIPGRILDMRVDQGDQVRAGQTLLRLDDSEFRQQVEIARSALDAVKATVEECRRMRFVQAILEQSRISIGA
jgi:multidrug efflux pump subunit AcrA (membrane-fusion protein)